MKSNIIILASIFISWHSFPSHVKVLIESNNGNYCTQNMSLTRRSFYHWFVWGDQKINFLGSSNAIVFFGSNAFESKTNPTVVKHWICKDRLRPFKILSDVSFCQFACHVPPYTEKLPPKPYCQHPFQWYPRKPKQSAQAHACNCSSLGYHRDTADLVIRLYS